MNCPNCKAYNPGSANYCSQCGAALAALDDEARGSQDQGPGQPEGSVGSEAPTPGAPQPVAMEAVVYAGFWIRGAALALDFIIVLAISLALSALGLMVIAWVCEPIYYVLFTATRGQTLGKMALGIKVVKPGRQTPGMGTAILREIPGKFISRLPLGLGYAWAGWDPCKQAWHDKIAGTYVIRTQSGLFQPPPR